MIGQKESPAANGAVENQLTHNAGKSPKQQGLKRNPDFRTVNQLSLAALPQLLMRWLPAGRFHGREYIALNPHRADRTLGSFRINTHTGRWADFATGDKGGDVISLAAYLFRIRQSEAKNNLQKMLGI